MKNISIEEKSDRLVISLAEKVLRRLLSFALAFTVFSMFILYEASWSRVDTKSSLQIIFTYIYLLVFPLFGVSAIYKSVKLLRHGEGFNFDSVTGVVFHNAKPMCDGNKLHAVILRSAKFIHTQKFNMATIYLSFDNGKTILLFGPGSLVIMFPFPGKSYRKALAEASDEVFKAAEKVAHFMNVTVRNEMSLFG